MIEYIAIRNVTKQECPWLYSEVQKGDTFYSYLGCTYGCISDSGIAVTENSCGEAPFFELPANAVRAIND
jgi:hypothetical protein